MPSRQCLKCGKLTGGRSYCRSCSIQRERERLKRAPWLRLYDMPEWNTLKWQVHKRDGYRCTFVDGRGRCSATARTSTIEAHHTTKVRVLYAQSRSWSAFLTKALDGAQIVTLCYKHHYEVDHGRKPGRSHRAGFSARPGGKTKKTGTVKPKSYARDKRA